MISIYESCWQHQFIISKIHLKTKIDSDSFIKRYPKCFFFGPESARSYKIGVSDNNWIVDWLVGWLVDWLVGWLVTQFSQKDSNDFSDFLHEVRRL